LNSNLLISALLTLKHSFDEAYLENRAVFLLEGAVDREGNLFRALFVYFFNRIKNEKSMTKVLDVDTSFVEQIRTEMAKEQ